MKKSMVLIILAALVLTFSTTGVAQEEQIKQIQSALKAGQFSKAAGLAERMTQEFPDWMPGYLWLGEAHQGLGNYDKAIRAFNKGLDYANGSDQSFMLKYRIVESEYKSGDYDATLKAIKSAERHKSSKYYNGVKGKIAMMEGYSSFNTGNYNDAIAAFKPMVDSGKASADVLRAVAKSYQETGQNKNAINVIERVVESDPTDLNAHKILVKSYTNDKNWSKVVASADAALKNFGSDPELHFLKGQAHFYLKQHQSARNHLKTSLDIRPADDVRYLYAQSFLKTGNYFEATEQFDLCKSSFADDPNFFLSYAYAWIEWVPSNTEEYTGKREEASFKTALENASTLLQQSKTLGGNATTINGYMEVVNNKLDRLEKGKFFVEEYEISIDPETGEIIKKKIGDDKDQ